MARGISNGPNSRPLDDTLAQTGPGIPDDALLEGEEIAPPVDDTTVERVREQLDHLGEEGPRADEA